MKMAKVERMTVGKEYWIKNASYFDERLVEQEKMGNPLSVDSVPVVPGVPDQDGPGPSGSDARRKIEY